VTGTIGLIGGTGPEGKGLAARFAAAGLDVVIGSRSAERGEEAAQEIATLAGRPVRGATNAGAAQAAAIVVVTIPYTGQQETLSALAGDIGNRIVVSTVVPLEFSRRRVAMLTIPAGSAAEEAQTLLPDARVTSAFHNLSAKHLLEIEHEIDGDVVVCSDDAEALAEVIELAGLIKGVRGINGGPLANSHYVEGLTALIVNINRIHKKETQVRIVGL
jgi:8-hydroxy-5-deazaflavin:NADPH oxidoreductase